MDVIVTVPKNFTHPCAPGLKGLAAWIAEGDAAGCETWSGHLWAFTTWGSRPSIEPGGRVYIVCEDRLRGYAPLVELEFDPPREGWLRGEITFWRGGGAVAVTIDQKITGFRGWRYRWWQYADERPFPAWKGNILPLAKLPLFAQQEPTEVET